MKKIIVLFGMMLIAMLAISVVNAAEEDIQIQINGETVITDVSPFIQNGTTFAPLRVIEKIEGLAIKKWDHHNKRVMVTNGQSELVLQVGDHSVQKNGETLSIAEPPVIQDGRVMVPLRFISEALHRDVAWDAGERTVYIATNDSSMIEMANVDDVTLLASVKNDSDTFQDIVVETKDMSRSFPWRNVTNPTYYPDIHIWDVDEDGKDEIVILLSAGYGTNTYIQDIHILNMEDLSELEMEDPIEAINSQVTSTITKNNGNVQVLVELNGEKAEKTYEESDAALWNDEVSFGAILKYEVINDTIIAHVPGAVSPAMFAVTAVVEYGPDLQVRHIEMNHQ